MEWNRVAGGDAVELLLRRQYATRLHSRGGVDGVALANLDTGPVAFGRAVFDVDVDVRGEPRGALGIGRSFAGRVSHTVGGRELRWAPGALFLAVDPAAEYVAHLDHASLAHTTIDTAVFDQLIDPTEPRLRWKGRSPISGRAASAWNDAHRTVSTLLTQAGPDASSLITGPAARFLAAVTLATFANSAVAEPTALDRRDAHPATVRRALALIENHADRDLSVADLARAAGVTPRAVQLAFRRHLGTTPMAAVRRARLSRADAELRTLTPDETSVTAVAARWGWSHPRRFTTAYRAAYGRHPREVLGEPPEEIR